MERKILPAIYNKRAAKILGYQVVACYQIDETKPNIVECVMPVGTNRYIDTTTNKEINALSIQLVADEAGKEDTNKLIGGGNLPVVFTDEQKEIIRTLTEEAPEYKHRKTPLSTVKKTQKAKSTKKPK